MAITTLDGLLAALQPSVGFYKVAATAKAANLIHSTMYVAGMPGTGTVSSAGAAGEALSSSSTPVDGQVPFPAAVGGKSVYLARLEVSAGANIGTVFLYDRLWQNSGLSVTSTSSQTVSSVTLPARDVNASTNGVGVYLGMEVTTTLGAGTPTLTVTYTNAAGTGSRSGTIGPISTTSNAGTFYPMTMQAGDTGVRSVQSIISSATMTSGAYSLVMYRQLAGIGTPTDNELYDRDAVALGFPKIADGAVPYFVYRTTSTALGQSDMAVVWAQG